MRIPRGLRLLRQRKGSYHSTLRELEKCCDKHLHCPYQEECCLLWARRLEEWPLEKDVYSDGPRYRNEEQKYCNWMPIITRREIANARRNY